MTTTDHATSPPAIPIACNPSAIDQTDRPAHGERAQRLFTQVVQERRELADGLAFRVTAADYDLVTAFVSQERLCCPFFQFTIELAPNEGPIWLRITGAPSAKAILDEGLRQMSQNGGDQWH